MFLDLFKEFAIHDMEVTSSVPLCKALLAELKGRHPKHITQRQLIFQNLGSLLLIGQTNLAVDRYIKWGILTA